MSKESENVSLLANSKKTFGEILGMWIENCELKNKGATVNKYQKMAEAHIIPEFGNVRINEMTPEVINRFLQNKLVSGRIDGKGGLSNSYVRTMTIIITSALKFATERKLCEPLSSIILKPKTIHPDIRILTREEQKKLETYVISNNSLDSLGVLISLYTGLRIGEICALKWSDIDFDKKIIKVRHTISRINMQNSKGTKLILDTPKTKTSIRDIPISYELSEIIMKKRETSCSEFVISNKEGFLSPRTFDYRFHNLIKRADIKKINCHALRHTFATRCVEAGVDVKSLSEILGHSNVSITLNTYVHSSMEMKRKQLEKIYALM